MESLKLKEREKLTMNAIYMMENHASYRQTDISPSKIAKSGQGSWHIGEITISNADGFCIWDCETHEGTLPRQIDRMSCEY